MSFKYRFLNVIISPFKLITTEPTTNVKNKKKSFYYTTVQSHYRLTQDNITTAALCTQKHKALYCYIKQS